MKTVQLLESDDVIDAEDWCRPLVIEYNYCCEVPTECRWLNETVTPVNNMKWVKVKYILSDNWYNKTVAEVNELRICYEFARGEVPIENQLDLTDYIVVDMSKS